MMLIIWVIMPCGLFLIIGTLVKEIEMSKISAIIPVYNSEQYLVKCLDSVLGQTLKDFEIIIVNDGSPDNSQKIIDEYLERYPDIIKCFYQENAGQAAARNNAMQYATGEFLMFIDSDDYIESDTFEKSYNYAKENSFDIVCFNMLEEKDGNKTKACYRKFEQTTSIIKYVLNESSPCNKIIKREIFANNNLSFTENRIYEDLELIPRLALYTDKIGYMDDYLYIYVIHENSTMRQKEYNPKLASIYPVVETLKNSLGQQGYQDEVEYLYIEHLMHSAVLRYLGYKQGKEDIIKISKIMKRDYPNWRKNKYFKQMDWKYKLFCNLVSFKQVALLKKILGV